MEYKMLIYNQKQSSYFRLIWTKISKPYYHPKNEKCNKMINIFINEIYLSKVIEEDDISITVVVLLFFPIILI